MIKTDDQRNFSRGPILKLSEVLLKLRKNQRCQSELYLVIHQLDAHGTNEMSPTYY